MELRAWRLIIRIKKSDQLRGNSIEEILLDFLRANRVWGATVWVGVDGFGKRRKAVRKVEGITFDCPLVIEAIDEKERLEPLLIEIRQIVGDNGLVTLQEVGII
ncbi:DUF190 domain-containing protein [Nitrososphaera viennensis]|uniref:Uncharacterized protein n=2 Tax=Nitrososphaera viennensis TaxID=1034015 RepID=A0A060HFS9_9ARCH|nr:DUF190 domain-containing protein [Nitrososphaera viennensis]AIC15454.1 hypothetical protein NVIE_012210 [Nitrososphaera viennensis EN76]UVS70344.1 DUF190 domain-containing protein [Nitrososphaera viennensis]